MNCFKKNKINIECKKCNDYKNHADMLINVNNSLELLVENMKKDLNDAKQCKIYHTLMYEELLKVKQKLIHEVTFKNKLLSKKNTEIQQYKEKYEETLQKLLIMTSEYTRLIETLTCDYPQDCLCNICKERPLNIILYPCAHICICRICFYKLSDKCCENVYPQCPICRCEVLYVNDCFLS
jgi:hypothetical protein